MSRYPPPYQPPQGPLGYQYHQPGADARGPARRASVMLWVMGALFSLCGLCTSSVFWVLPIDQIVAQAKGHMSSQQINQLGSIDLAQMMRIGYTVVGLTGLLFGVMFITTAFFVHQGRRGGIITAMVFCILLDMLCALLVVAFLAGAASGAPANLVLALLCFVVGGAALPTIVWLIQALRASGLIAQQQWQLQYWQSQQQQSPAYGYGTPPPPPAQPPPPPPATPPG